MGSTFTPAPDQYPIQTGPTYKHHYRLTQTNLSVLMSIEMDLSSNKGHSSAAAYWPTVCVFLPLFCFLSDPSIPFKLIFHPDHSSQGAKLPHTYTEWLVRKKSNAVLPFMAAGGKHRQRGKSSTQLASSQTSAGKEREKTECVTERPVSVRYQPKCMQYLPPTHTKEKHTKQLTERGMIEERKWWEQRECKMTERGEDEGERRKSRDTGKRTDRWGTPRRGQRWWSGRKAVFFIVRSQITDGGSVYPSFVSLGGSWFFQF